VPIDYIDGSGRMPPLGDLLTGPLGSLGFGGLAGAVVGYAAKKLTKLAALLLGVVFILVQVLSHYGLVTVDWDATRRVAEDVWQAPGSRSLAERAWDVLTASLPFAGGFAGGFVVGFRMG